MGSEARYPRGGLSYSDIHDQEVLGGEICIELIFWLI